MDTEKKKTGKTSITKKGGRKSKQEQELQQQQIYDADAELALALSTSYSDAATASGFSTANGTDNIQDEHLQHLMLLKQQEEADAEYARQLAEEFAAAEHTANAHANTQAHDQDQAQAQAQAMGGDDMDEVLEEIARMEAQERLKATGHAYKGKTSIDRVLADEDEEEARIRESVKRKADLNAWREERERQDAEYAASEEADRLQELSKKDSPIPMPIPVHIPIPTPTPTHTSDTTVPIGEEQEPEPEIPLTRDELRKARLAFFTGTHLQTKS